MNRPRLDVAEVIRSCRDEFLETYVPRLTPEQQRALKDLVSCRTAALGGHVLGCPECGHQQIAYNSCGNRHCPTCQGTAAARWLEARAAELLPVPYFHVVFTLPAPSTPLPCTIRGSSTTCCCDPPRKPCSDWLPIPSTWEPKSASWPCSTPGARTFNFTPTPTASCRAAGCPPTAPAGSVRPTSFSSRFESSAECSGASSWPVCAAFAQSRLRFPGALTAPAARDEFERLLTASTKTDWVVYAKPPFGGPQQVLKYLAQYTHRSAISNHRLLDLDQGRVSFRYKDYAHGSRKRTMKLSAVEFVRRFLLHVLPAGFVRIRHYGILSNRHRQEKLQLCRSLLGPCLAAQPELPEVEAPESSTSISPTRVCPVCGAGRMVLIEELPPRPAPWDSRQTAGEWVMVDSS